MKSEKDIKLLIKLFKKNENLKMMLKLFKENKNESICDEGRKGCVVFKSLQTHKMLKEPNLKMRIQK